MSPLRFLAPLCVLAALVGSAGAQDKKDKAVSRFTIMVPEDGHGPTLLTIGGTKTDQRGTERKFVTPPLEKGYTYSYTFEAAIEPNNYTKITRTKTVNFKAGDSLTVDLREKDEKTDKIVVRWVPTPDDVVDEMCKLGKITKDDIVYDLGCGDAVMLIRPIQKFSAKRGVGIDIDPKILERAKENVKKANLEEKIELRVGDILNVKDMSEATLVLLYIGDDLGERLGPVLQKTLKPGARVVSHRFLLGDWTPTETKEITGEDGFQYTLHLWIAGAAKK